VERPTINRDEGSTLAFSKGAGPQGARRADDGKTLTWWSPTRAN
jgi:hypothetical protein